MAGLVPGIHVFGRSPLQDVDIRHKAGHDESAFAVAGIFKREKRIQKSRPLVGGRLKAAKRPKNVRSAQKTDALLFARFFDGGRLRRQLQHGRFLTFAQ